MSEKTMATTGRFAVPGILSTLYLAIGCARHDEPYEPDGPAQTGRITEIWMKRMRYRWHLKRLLNTHPGYLADIGLTAEMAEFEVSKPFWRE